MHTCDINAEAFEADVRRFDKVCSVVNGLKGARIAQFGTRPAAFQTVRFSEKLLQKSGVTVVQFDLSELLVYAQSLPNSTGVKEKVQEIKSYGFIPESIANEAIEKSAKLQMAMEKFMFDNKCVAGAVKCWDSIQLNYGCAACLPMSMISENDKPMACETDIMGAVSMLAMSLASGKPSGYLDWNNNYGDDRDKCVLIHCAN